MKYRISFILMFVILLTIFNCSAANDSNLTNSHKKVLEKVIQNYENHQYFEFKSDYKFKCYDCDSFLYYTYYNVNLQMIPSDTIFGCYFFYSYRNSEVDTVISKYYNGDKLFIIDTAKKECLRFDSHTKQISPIVGAHDGFIIELTPFFNPEILKKVFFSDKQRTRYYDTAIGYINYLISETVFTDEENHFSQHRKIFMNTENFLIERIKVQSILDGQEQINELVYTDFKLKDKKQSNIDHLFQETVNENFRIIDYKPMSFS